MAFQTTANSNAFILGSCHISVPSSSGGYVKLGSARGVKLTETFESVEIELDNAPKVVVGAKKQEVKVEGNLIELDWHRLAALRGSMSTAGSLDTWSYDSTTLEQTFTSGGKVSMPSQSLYLTHTGASSSETIVFTIYSGKVDAGLTLAFPSDNDAQGVMEIPFSYLGKCQSTRATGSQLMNIVDLRNSVYSTSYFSTSI